MRNKKSVNIYTEPTISSGGFAVILERFNTSHTRNNMSTKNKTRINNAAIEKLKRKGLHTPFCIYKKLCS